MRGYLHRSMCYSEHITLSELVRGAHVSLNQLCEQIVLSIRRPAVIVELFPLSHLLESHASQQDCLETQAEVFRQRVQTAQVMKPRHLADNAVIPLYVVDVFDAALDVSACTDEPVTVGEGDLSQNLRCS